MPFNYIMDRTRTCHQSECMTNEVDVDAALDSAKTWISDMPRWAIQRGKWFGQRTHVTVGVEKEALAGVFERPCQHAGVGLFVYRGYSSLSALHQWASNVAEAYNYGENDVDNAVMLYFGDSDPDGWEIPRVALRTIYDIAHADRLELPPITLERIALNMGQIKEYDPPSFGAKMTSSRYQGYWDEHGTDDAWELDALRPDVLQRMIAEAVEPHFDTEVHTTNQSLIAELRTEVKEAMREPGWIADALEG